ncbi:hypothetical protein [Alicyclobacillus macrosporangiidus]|uniref:CobQ/CobB/MinD/ParA nucleotide binding domain-containing protein n=1 Tax=Alicyclobacillus macrosporangiidus TaxID=392015 RepID=A0A1I7KCY5_9BACL|nr:hypothetical protein [Alicyclobacillus macrosporangiidus]SFU95210.1 hypothetical protein SAMN05421543_11535 [Alicyclobacillus macrosporangiidus]
MAKLVIATGLDDLDEALRNRYKDLYTVQTVSYLQGLTVLPLDQGDVVILTRVLPDSGAGDAGFVAVVEHLRRRGVRIVFLDQSRPAGDPLVTALVHRGVYDLLLADEIVLEAVFERIDHPGTYGDVQAFVQMEDDLYKGQRSRKPLTWRKDAPESVEQSTEPQTAKRPAVRPGLRLSDWRARGPITKSAEPRARGPRVVTVSGLPGSGVSFVALHLARALVNRDITVLIEASDRPILTRWLHGPTDWDGANTWVHGGLSLNETWRLSDGLMVLPAQGCGPSLASVRKALRGIPDQVTVVIDARLSDLEDSVDVLVVPPDPEKVSLVSHLSPKLLVVNMAPNRLPVHPGEYAGAWSKTVVCTCPFLPDQSLAVIEGRALDGLEETGQVWMDALLTPALDSRP